MFSQKEVSVFGRAAIAVELPFPYSLEDTLECGQCFRYQLKEKREDYIEYLIPVGECLIEVGQRSAGELLFFGITEEELLTVAAPFFSLDTDFGEIKEDIVKRTDSDWLKAAADYAGGIAILKQDEWEAVFSFIVSQNNNIPRIRKIIKELSFAYGENLAEKRGLDKCPLSLIDGTPCNENCSSCGICYSFPKPEAVSSEPAKMLPSKPGFRYKYLLDAAEKVSSGEINLSMIAAARSYTHTVECLKGIKGVGDKVASCAALFGFGNLEAFPIDVWMKRAIDEYFDGKLDPTTLGRYAGVAQQYIFHYIRYLSKTEA